MNFLFHYMARWKAVNWTRYHYILTHLANMGHHVYVLQPPSAKLAETNFQEIEVEVPENLHLIDVDVNPWIWSLNLPLNKLVKKGYYTVASRRMVKDLVRRHHIDALLVYNIPQYPLMDGIDCLKIFDYADDYIPMLSHELGKLSNNLTLGYARSLLNKMIRKADLTLTVSSVLADTIKGEKANIRVLPNGVNLDEFPLHLPGLARGDRRPVAGFIGAFEYFIDFDLILAVAGRLPEYDFLFVGSGRELERVKRMTVEMGLRNVILTGGVPHSQVAGYIARMDVCLNVFKKIDVSHSACPIKLFEYLAMKKPVISTRLKEVEKIDEYFIFYADTVDEYVHSIRMILENMPLASRYAQRGYDIVLDKYGWDKTARQLLALVEEIEKEQPPRNSGQGIGKINISYF